MMGQGTDDEELAAEYEYDAAPAPAAVPAAAARPDHPAVQTRVQPARRPQARPAPAAAAGSLPYALLGFLGAVILGLLGLIVFLLLGRASTPPGAGPATGGNPPAGNPVPLVTSAAAAPSEAPPRMPLAEFKALYDDPAKRPVIVDVRAADAYAQGHIVGAVSIPQSDLATRYNEIPKDRVVVAYCQ